MSGTGSTWTSSGSLHIGYNASFRSEFHIYSGGTVSNVNGLIAVNSGSSGTATADGTDATWTNSGNLSVGVMGSGELSVLNGATVSNVTAQIADQPGSTGTVTVRGTGSSWTNSGDLYVGGNSSMPAGPAHSAWSRTGWFRSTAHSKFGSTALSPLTGECSS